MNEADWTIICSPSASLRMRGSFRGKCRYFSQCLVLINLFLYLRARNLLNICPVLSSCFYELLCTSKRLIAFSLICLLGTFSVCAAEAENFFSRYNFKYITDETGLPHNYVDDIYKDSDGYVWVATHQGAGRYDGYQCLNYNSYTSPVRLKNDFVRQFCEDRFHRLWIASEGGIDVLDLNTYEIVVPEGVNGAPLDLLMNEYIHALYKDDAGNIWIAGDKDLWCIELDAKGGVSNYFRLKRGDMSTGVRAMADVHGTMYVGIDNEVCTVERQDGHKLVVTSLADKLPSFSEDWRILCMQEDGDWLWLGSNRGLFRFDYHTGELKRYRYSTHREGYLSQAYITDLGVTEDGYLIAATLNGLNVYDRQTDSFSFIRQSVGNESATVNCNAINCLLTEGETIWVGTETGGVNLLSLKRLKTEVWKPAGAQQGRAVNAVIEDSEGCLWMSVVEKGLLKWNEEQQQMEHYMFVPGDVSSITNNTVNGLLIDRDSHLWAYTWGVGINELDLSKPGNRYFKRYTREEMPSLQADFISSACEDVLNHGIWFGSTRGLNFLDKRTGTFLLLDLKESDKDFEAIHALLVDRKNRLWVGTTQGVYVIDLGSFAKSRRNFDYVCLKYKLDDRSSTQVEKISCIIEDREGRIWLGGIGSGLYQLIDDRNNRFQFQGYSVADGLPDNTVIGLAEDGNGFLWIATGNGLSRLDVSSMTFSNYTQADGLPATQFYWNGVYYSRKWDMIYLATSDGLVMVHPSEQGEEIPGRQVKLASLMVNGNWVYPSGNGDIQEEVVRKGRISIHEKDRRFTVGFTTQNYGNNNRVRFAYRLKGYEPEWNETRPGEYQATYNAVPAGRYVLQVKATDEMGRWSEQVTEMELNVVPYFYKTVWFYLLVALAVCLLAWFFYRRKTRSYREQQLKLEKTVEKRTQELAERNGQLEVMARNLQEVTEEKIAFFTNITHEFRTPVTLINGPIEHALKELDDGDVKKQLEIASRNSRYLLQLVNELMDFRKLDADKVTLNRTAQNFEDFLQELLLPFKVFARERNIEIRTYYRLDAPCLMMDGAYMRKAMINLVSNAIKFTPDGGRIDIFVASVKGNQGEPLLYINVCDTGHGISEGDMDKIFDRFYQSKDNKAKYSVYGQSGTGIGLFLCKKIVELHGGKIYARNNHRRGASFRILMPLLPGEPVTVAGEAMEGGLAVAGTVAELPVDGEHVRRETILIVEDNKDMRTYIRSLLDKDYRIYEAGNGEEALAVVKKHVVDLIISDLMMPVMDGLELSRRIKENLATSHIPFLMLTAIRSDVQEKKSFEIGVDEYLCKPFDEEVLCLRVKNILKLRRQYKKMFSSSSQIEELHIKEESKDSQFVRQALSLMEKNYADSQYNLESFVRDMGYSKTLVNKKMQELTGQPIGQFMKNFRLNVARKMIQENQDKVNVSEVAYAVGFNDPKYFTKCFKEFFGYLPSSGLNKKGK